MNRADPLRVYNLPNTILSGYGRRSACMYRSGAKCFTSWWLKSSWTDCLLTCSRCYHARTLLVWESILRALVLPCETFPTAVSTSRLVHVCMHGTSYIGMQYLLALAYSLSCSIPAYRISISYHTSSKLVINMN